MINIGNLQKTVNVLSVIRGYLPNAVALNSIVGLKNPSNPGVSKCIFVKFQSLKECEMGFRLKNPAVPI